MQQNQQVKQFRLWPRQLAAFLSPATEILYGGSAGPGKSHLLRVACLTWCAAIPGLQVYLFRRKYRDLIQGHMEGPTGLKAMLAEMEQRGLVQIVELEVRFKNGPSGGFEGGSRISLNHCQYEQNVLDYKTIEFHVLAIEEATEFTEFMIRFLRSRVRMPDVMEERIPKEWAGRFPRIVYATNPGGPGHSYFKRAFVDRAVGDAPWRAEEDDGGQLRQFIQARLRDNPSVNPEKYAANLKGIGSPAYVKALLDGDWSAPLGAFYTEFDPLRHVVPDFEPPRAWARFRSFDWGMAEPFAVYWWTVSDGRPFTCRVTSRKHCFPRGALIAYREWYGCNSDKPSEGLRMRNEDVAAGIVQRSDDWEKRVDTLCDSLPYQDRGGELIAHTFARNGVLLTEGDTSRVPGWSQLRSRLVGPEEADGKLGPPMIYFVESCVFARRYLTELAYHPSPAKREDAQEHGEATHAPDAIRLACMAHSIIKDLVPEPQAMQNLHSGMTILQAIERAREIQGHDRGGW